VAHLTLFERHIHLLPTMIHMNAIFRYSLPTAWLCACLSTTSVQAADAQVELFLTQIKSDQGAARVTAITQAGPMGAAAVIPLAEIASGTTRDNSLAALTALKNVAAYAGRPGAAEQRKAVAEALTQVLDARFSKVTRCLALELLSITADDAQVPNVAALLNETDLDVQDEAKRSLQGIPGQASLKALIAALPKSEGRFRLALIAALGQRAAPEATEALIPLTDASDMDVVLSALDALGRIGIAKDDRVHLPSFGGLTEPQQSRLTASHLRWADQRVAKGAIEDALEVYGALWENSQVEHVLCAALIGAAKAAPDRVVEFAVRGLLHEHNTVRATAAQVLENQPGEEAKAKQLLDAFKDAKPESRDLILRVLRTWNDKKLGG